MKRLLPAIALVLLFACTVPAQRKAFNTIASVQATSTTAVDSYFTLVIQGKAPTNGVPTVTRAYNALQQSVLAALAAVQNNSNALAPGSLIVESTALINVITQAKGK